MSQVDCRCRMRKMEDKKEEEEGHDTQPQPPTPRGDPRPTSHLGSVDRLVVNFARVTVTIVETRISHISIHDG
jgi:hypothetical protein